MEATSSPGNPGEPVLDLTKNKQVWALSYLLRRGLWNLVSVLLFRPTPRRLGNKWRIVLLRLFGATIEGWPFVAATCKILDPAKLRMEHGSAIGEDVVVYNYAQITVGKMAVVSQGAVLCTGTHDYNHPHMPLISKPIILGDCAWVCYEAFVHPGVTVAEGAILGARAVAVKNIPPWGIYAGNPAVLVKPRARPSL